MHEIAVCQFYNKRILINQSIPLNVNQRHKLVDIEVLFHGLIMSAKQTFDTAHFNSGTTRQRVQQVQPCCTNLPAIIQSKPQKNILQLLKNRAYNKVPAPT